MPNQLALFLVGSVLVTVVPGPDMALVTRQVVTRGRAAAQATIFGNLSGLIVHATALAFGLSALLVASATAYTVVKLLGAAYLVYLGLRAFWHARGGSASRPVLEDDRAPARRRSSYGQGLVSTVLNPKPALFFLSYVPQFIDRQGSVVLQVAILAGLHIVIGFVWLTTYARLVSRLHDVISTPKVKAALDRITGAVLIALGVRIAFERR